jgi:predicted phosphoribosyltransferase
MVVTGTTARSVSTFKSVGQYYQEFKQIDDEKIIEICKKNNLLYTK